ncbi:MAG: HEAT repeat domain-containing protein [Anaerolineales bacterium]|nr:HEAT repeat domain-containing protein [Anaerolineales bacterium]
MIPTDPFIALATLAIDLLPWAADKIAGHFLEKGTDASASHIKKWAKNRETQEQLRAAIEVALVKTRQDARYHDFDQLFYLESLARDVVRVALVPSMLAEPDYDAILKSSARLTVDREHARSALEFFFDAFRHLWEKQPVSEALRPAYETIRTRRQVQEIAQTMDVSIEELRAIRQRLEMGMPTFLATPHPPSPDLVCAYLEEVAAQKPYTLWSDQTYIDRTVTKTEDLFARTVARYDPHAPEREGKAKPEPPEEALAREKKLVLLGEPGMGKTTSLVHLAWEAANRALTKPPASSEPAGGSPEIPIYVELKYYNGEPELETLLARRVNEILRAHSLMLAPDLAESTRILKAWLAQSDARFLLLLDGLNEVRLEFHTAVRGALQALLNSPHCIVISCRERDYDASLRDCAAFVLQGLQEDEIGDYLQRTLGDKGTRLFDAQIRWDEKMQTLAANPLMLWLIAIVARADPEARLPANRGKLFQQFVALMPRLRAREGHRAEIAPDVVETALAKLGFEMLEHKQQFVGLREARGWQIPTAGKDLEDVLTQAKDWRLLKSDGRLGEPVEFLHQLFLGYFAARHLESEIKNQGFDTVLGERSLISKWEEVIVMLAGISEDAEGLIKWMSAQAIARRDRSAPYLVQRCWKSSVAAKDPVARDVVTQAFLPLLGDELPGVRWEAASALGEIGGPQAVTLLAIALRDENEWVRHYAQLALEDVGETGDLRAIELLITALRHTDPDIRAGAASSLGRIGDPRALPGLERVLQGDNAWSSFGSVADAAREAAEKIRKRSQRMGNE